MKKKFSKYRYLAVITLVAVFVVGFVELITPRAYAAQAPVDLQSAAPFAILSGTPNITNVPTSVITGNVGLSPAAGSGIGLTCAEVTGTIYSVDATGPLPCRVTNGPLLVTAKNDLTAAFIDVAGRTPVTTVPTELGGTTKFAGVYADSSSTTFQITAGAGPLVLDGQGNSNAIFIFEMNSGSTGLTVGPGSTVSLINGASACNVYWKVDTASINTTAVFKGNILALTSITVANGANIEGRLLARNANVTLVADTITRPTCAAATTGSGSSSSSTVPNLPNTGISPKNNNSASWKIIIPTGVTVGLFSLYLVRKKRAV